MTVAVHDRAGLCALANELRTDPGPVLGAARRVLREGAGLAEALRGLPADLVTRIHAGEPAVLERVESARDGATRLLLEGTRGARYETVLLRPESGRTTQCLSVQAGCDAGCVFCATGQLGLKGRLALDDVLGQVLLGRRLAADEGRHLRNLVFMGMGEPLHEEELLFAALERLLDDRGFGFGPRRVCVSTVGVPAGMVRLAQRFPGVRQALSLHSAVAEERAALIPTGRRHGLEALREAVAEVGRLTGGRVFVEVLLLAGRTDRPEDEAALATWLQGLPVHLNLIPFNPPAGEGELEPTPEAEARALAGRFRDRGVPTTLRRSLGADIAAACGELALSSRATPRR